MPVTTLANYPQNCMTTGVLLEKIEIYVVLQFD